MATAMTAAMTATAAGAVHAVGTVRTTAVVIPAGVAVAIPTAVADNRGVAPQPATTLRLRGFRLGLCDTLFGLDFGQFEFRPPTGAFHRSYPSVRCLASRGHRGHRDIPRGNADGTWNDGRRRLRERFRLMNRPADLRLFEFALKFDYGFCVLRHLLGINRAGAR